MDKIIKNEIDYEDQLTLCYELYDDTIEDVANGEDLILSMIESAPPEFQLSFSEFLEEGLLKNKSVMTESVFVESNSRGLEIYRKIMNEHGLDPKV